MDPQDYNGHHSQDDTRSPLKEQVVQRFVCAAAQHEMPYRVCLICSEYAHCRYCAHCYRDGPWYCSVECQRLHWVQERRAVCGSVARQSIFDALLIQSVPHATNEIGRTIAKFEGILYARRH